MKLYICLLCACLAHQSSNVLGMNNSKKMEALNIMSQYATPQDRFALRRTCKDLNKLLEHYRCTDAQSIIPADEMKRRRANFVFAVNQLKFSTGKNNLTVCICHGVFLADWIMGVLAVALVQPHFAQLDTRQTCLLIAMGYLLTPIIFFCLSLLNNRCSIVGNRQIIADAAQKCFYKSRIELENDLRNFSRLMPEHLPWRVGFFDRTGNALRNLAELNKQMEQHLKMSKNSMIGSSTEAQLITKTICVSYSLIEMKPLVEWLFKKLLLPKLPVEHS